jgi:hypothetical protein
MIEGATEEAFLPKLREFLVQHLKGRMPSIEPQRFDGPIPKNAKLRRQVERLLGGRRPFDAVIALTDVYTGKNDFVDANDVKRKLGEWVGANPHFHAHAAQFEFEAWLLPYWPTIQKLAGHQSKKAPGRNPETLNQNRPPSYYIREIFRTGKSPRYYNKPRDAKLILQRNDLIVAANACAELRSLLNTILRLSGGKLLAMRAESKAPRRRRP